MALDAAPAGLGDAPHRDEDRLGVVPGRQRVHPLAPVRQEPRPHRQLVLGQEVEGHCLDVPLFVDPLDAVLIGARRVDLLAEGVAVPNRRGYCRSLRPVQTTSGWPASSRYVTPHHSSLSGPGMYSWTMRSSWTRNRRSKSATRLSAESATNRRVSKVFRQVSLGWNGLMRQGYWSRPASSRICSGLF